MADCERFEIEIERRLHGDLGEAEAARLAAHLSTCASCRAFEATARATEAGMRGAADEVVQAIDWAQVDRAISAWRRRGLVTLGTWAVLGLALAGSAWIHRDGRGPAVDASLAAGACLVALGVRFALDLRRQRRTAALGRGPELLEALRADLRDRRRATTAWLVYAPFLTAFLAGAAVVKAEGAFRLVLVAAAAVVAATWLAVLLVKRPRLARERAALDGATGATDA